MKSFLCYPLYSVFRIEAMEDMEGEYIDGPLDCRYHSLLELLIVVTSTAAFPVPF